MENPNSYITTDTNTNQLSNKMSNILSELMSTYKINSTQEQITEQHIPQIVNNLKNIKIHINYLTSQIHFIFEGHTSIKTANSKKVFSNYYDKIAFAKLFTDRSKI
jgi:hypothetical protein